MLRRLFWIKSACAISQLILYLILITVIGLILLLKNPLTELIDTDKTLTVHLSLTLLNESIQSVEAEPISGPVLIFTCLGSLAFTKHQTYIWESISQARVMNPNIKIVVILSKDAFQSNVAQKIKDLNITPEINDDLILTNPLVQDFHRVFFVQGSMEPGGNKEFVQFTLERLLSIHSYMKKNSEVHVFHIENDNMLYVDLRKLNRRLNKCGVNLAVPRAAVGQAVISFIYIKNFHALGKFVKWCLNVFRLGRSGAMKFLNTSFINDMTLTARYLELRGSLNEQSKLSGVYELPTQFTYELQECCLCFLENEPLIFDACVLGQYFGGTYEKPNASHWETNRLVDPRGETLSWRSLNPETKVPYIRNRRIANIHVHSKRLEQFSSLGNHQTKGFPYISS